MLTTSTEEIHSVAKKAIVAQYGESRNGFFDQQEHVAQAVAQRIAVTTLSKEGKTFLLDDPDKARLLMNVTNIIWNNFSGGDSAHAVTMAIFAELGIDVTSPSCQAYVS